jgi:hypothetical protein
MRTESRTGTRRISACLSLLVLALSEDLRSAPPRVPALGPDRGIRLRCNADKRIYRYGEAIEVTALLENVSDTPIYVGREIGDLFTTSTDHCLVLSAYASNGKEVWFPRMDAATGWPPNATPSEMVQRSYLILYPRRLYGVRRALPVRLKPGRYRLVARYSEYLADHIGTADARALPFKIHATPLTAESTITVRGMLRSTARAPSNYIWHAVHRKA